MLRPAAGLCLECEFVRMRDGDTAEIKGRNSGRVWAVRLLDCWVKDRSDADKKAKAYAEMVLGDIALLFVWIPIPKDSRNVLRSLFSFDRVLGHLFVSSDRTISQMLVEQGFATATKPRSVK